MKKSGIIPVVILCCFFIGLLFGIFIGRNYNHTEIQVSKKPNQSLLETATAEESQLTQPININTATLDQLILLPGIGPTLAQNIINYREENGPFISTSQLTMVNGIGVTKLNQILDYVTIGEE